METNGQMYQRVTDIVRWIPIQKCHLIAGQRSTRVSTTRQIRFDGCMIVLNDTCIRKPKRKLKITKLSMTDEIIIVASGYSPMHAFNHCQSACRRIWRRRRSCNESQLLIDSPLPLSWYRWCDIVVCRLFEFEMIKLPAQFSSINSRSGDDSVVLAPNRSVSLLFTVSFWRAHIEHRRLFGQFSNVHFCKQIKEDEKD